MSHESGECDLDCWTLDNIVRKGFRDALSKVRMSRNWPRHPRLFGIFR